MAKRIVTNVMKDKEVIKALAPYNIKSAKTFHGHDGDGYLQGNLYKGTKCIGTYAQDAWGGNMNATIKNQALHDEFIALLETFPVEKKEGTTFKYDYGLDGVMENMIHDVLELRALKRICKNKTLVRTTENKSDTTHFVYGCVYTPESIAKIRKMVEAKGHKIIEVLNDRIK